MLHPTHQRSKWRPKCPDDLSPGELERYISSPVLTLPHWEIRRWKAQACAWVAGWLRPDYPELVDEAFARGEAARIGRRVTDG